MSSSSASSDVKSLLQKLVLSIEKRKFDPDVIPNLVCFYNDKLVVWNEDDQNLNVCSLDGKQQIVNIQVIALSNPPFFVVTSLLLNPYGNYLSLSGTNGLMVVELPRNWAAQRNDSTKNSIKNTFLSRSILIGERMFLCNQRLKLLCVRWHPISKIHILILNNDNCIRIFNIENKYESTKTISLNLKDNSDFGRVSAFSDSFGENAVSFDFGQPLSRYHNSTLNDELVDIFPIFTLKGNGDVLLVYLSLKDLFFVDQIYGPLKMTPAAEDNYGSDACSIFCLDCVPPVIVIGTSSGILYHCVAIENDNADKQDSACLLSDVYCFTTSSGTNIVIPEVILYVLETIELSFPLTSSNQDSSEIYHSNSQNRCLQLIKDVNDSARYFCLHSFGIHKIVVSFVNQLPNSSEFHDEKSIVEYLICTRPTVENSVLNGCSKESFIVGVGLFIHHGFAYVAVLLNSAELISKRLTSAMVSNHETQITLMNASDIDLDKLLVSKMNGLPAFSLNNVKTAENKKTSFQDHLDKILVKHNSLPLIKSSKNKDSPVNEADLELLLNSIDVLKKEYLDKFILATKAIEKRTNVLKNDRIFQIDEIETLKSDKDQLLQNYVCSVKKFDKIKEAQNKISERLEKKITQIQNQRPTLSDAELNLKDELSKEQIKLAMYKQKFEQIKEKRRYQDAQLIHKSLITDDLSESGYASPVQIKNIKQRLAQQGDEISELVNSLNWLKANT